MGGKGGKTTTTQTQSVDPDFKERALNVFNRAQTFADQPFRPFTGQRVADFSPAEQAGFAAVNNFALAAQPGINSAMETTAALANTTGGAGMSALQGAGPSASLTDAIGLVRDAGPRPGLFQAQDMTRAAGVTEALLDAQAMARDAETTRAMRGAQLVLADELLGGPERVAAGINAYMNPYTQSVVDTTLGDIERSRQMAQAQNAAQAARASAFGGSRQGLQAAETDRAALEQAARTSAALRQSGFTTAAGLAQDAMRARISGASALGQLGATEQNLALQQAGQLGELGATQQQLALSQAGQLGSLASAEQQQLLARGMGVGQLGAEESRIRQAQAQAIAQAEQAQRAQQLQAANQLAALAAARQEAAIQGAQALLGAGGIQRTQDQANLDVQRQIFMEPQQDQLMRLQVLQGALGMFPNPVSTSQTQNQNPGVMGTIGQVGQVGAQAALAYALLCWVAREVYGAHNPRWVMFREWVLEDAPRWFRNLYARHGAAFAEWIADKPRLKGMIRSFMDSRIAAKFGEPR